MVCISLIFDLAKICAEREKMLYAEVVSRISTSYPLLFFLNLIIPFLMKYSIKKLHSSVGMS